MKLAEALLLRADIQKKIESLRSRIGQNTVVQEGEKPAEDPNALLDRARAACREFKQLVYAVNRANLNGTTAKGRTLTEALAERDALAVEHSIVQSTAASAAKPPERYGVKEIRWVKAVDVAALQKLADNLAKSLRELNAEIQEANWRIDIDGE